MAQGDGNIIIRSTEAGGVWELAPLETSPCTLACPTRINARGYVSLISDGRFAEALSLIRERNPFPGVCGRVCPRPCEAACVRGRYDEPIAICALKRFVFDVEMKRGIRPASAARVCRPERVAIIGAGPAGLSAARELALFGYPVTVFDEKDMPGGVMNCIPEFRLPRAVIRREARAILDDGVELVAGTRFGTDITWNRLKRRGYRALLLSTGAWRPVWKWGSPGIAGVFHGLDFLQHAALEIEGNRIAVAGDGMMALDCARTAIRLGASLVTLIIGTSRGSASARRDDLLQAEKEGIRLLFLARLSGLVKRGRKVAGIRCVKLTEGPADATGRNETVEVSGSEFVVDVDIFVDAHTRGIDVGAFVSKLGLAVSAAGTVVINPADSSAGTKGIFAAGDLVTGPRSVVEAIASGQKAAYGIHQYLSGETIRSPLDLTVDEAIAHREFMLEKPPGSKAPRERMPLEGARIRAADFREVEKGYLAQTARREAQRCLRCGPCGECRLCVDICEKKDFLLRVGDELSVSVHAAREFWSRAPERVTLELGGERVEANLARTVCAVREEACVGCGRCAEVCEYKAVQVETRPGGRFIAHIDELACKGCGNCVTVCPTGAIDQVNFERDAILKKLGAVAPSRTNVLFVCHWARPGRLDLPRDVLVIETMCVGRVTPRLILEAALRGSPRVLVAGCGEKDCHYGSGAANGARAVREARTLLRLFGLKPEIVSDLATSPEEFALAVNKWAWKSK